MPLYEYQCPGCGRFEIIQKFSEVALSVCPTCGKAVTKLPSAPAIQFKGSGWYITDYARKSSGAEGGGQKGDGAGDSAKGSSKPDSSSKTDSSKDKSSPATGSSKDSSASGSSPSK